MTMVVWRRTRLSKKAREDADLLALYLASGQSMAVRKDEDGLPELLPGCELQRLDITLESGKERTVLDVLIPEERHKALRKAHDRAGTVAVGEAIANGEKNVGKLKAIHDQAAQMGYMLAVKAWAEEAPAGTEG